MRWHRIFKRKRWFLNIPTFAWWFIWEFIKDSIMQATRDYFTQQGFWRIMLSYILQNPVVIVGLVAISVFLWAYIDTKNESKRTVDSEVAKILVNMRNRVMKLKDKCVSQYRLSHNITEFMDLHKAIRDAVSKNADLESIETSIKGKKLSRNLKKKRAQIDNLTGQIKPTLQIDWSLDMLKKLASTMDRLSETSTKQYKGLDTRKRQDKEWKKLFDRLQQVKIEFNDSTLNKVIDEYTDWLYAGIGYVMWTDMIRDYIPTANLPAEYLGSEAYNPYERVEKTITRLRSDIVARIKELEFMDDEPTTIKDTKIKLDAEKVDKATGMEIDNVQTDLSNVDIGVTAKDVNEATGLKITAQNREFALSSKVIMCSCGEVIRSVTTCGYEPTIKCPKCGKEYTC